MDNYNKEFVMDLFLDNSDVSSINRSVMAMADVLLDNADALNTFNELFCIENESQAKINNHSLETEPPHVIKDYYEEAIVHFSDEDYEATFKAKKSTVQALIHTLQDLIPPGTIPINKKVHVFLMFLVSDLSYSEIGKLFSLHKSTVSNIFQEIGSFIAENRFNYITWPSVEEQHVTRIKVNSRFKFPNCVGFLDACCLKLGQKKTKHDSILLQAVCDESLMFIDVHIGEMGKTRKNKVFKESILAQELQNFIDFDNHLLGDSQYKLKINLITPFTSEELLTSEEMKFNEIHWKTRSYIGHAFELLKEKFRKLNHIDICKQEFIHILIYSACVLHNFILIHEGPPVVKEEANICDDGITLNTNIVMTALEKRQFLCNYINYIDSDTDTLVET